MVCDGNRISVVEYAKGSRITDYDSESKCDGTLSQKRIHSYPLSFFGGGSNEVFKAGSVRDDYGSVDDRLLCGDGCYRAK